MFNDKYARVVFVKDFPSSLQDNLITDIADSNLNVMTTVKVGDKYKAAGVAMVGTYDECRAFTDKAKAAEMLPEPVCKIYQLKSGEENHNVRFAGSEELKMLGLRPDFTRYEKVYEMPLSNLPKCNTVPEQLEAVFNKFNENKPADFKGHSLSVSDVVELNKQPYFVDSVGFKKINNFLPEQTLESMQKEFIKNFNKRADSVKSEMELYALVNEAKKLGIDCEVEQYKRLEQKPEKKQSLPNKHMKRG